MLEESTKIGLGIIYGIHQAICRNFADFSAAVQHIQCPERTLLATG
jgi:hypothetical protein